MDSLPPPRRRQRRLADDDPIPTETNITPSKVRQPVNQILDNLNTKWDLGLPRLHGRDAEQAEWTISPNRQCSARLRYLYYKTGDLSELLQEFEKQASVIYSGWKFKPLAEGNVMPTRDANDSVLARRIIKGKVQQLSGKQKVDLLVCLEKILEQPYHLSRQSDSFKVDPNERSQNNRGEASSTQTTPTMTDHGKVTRIATPVTPSVKTPSKEVRGSAKRSGGICDRFNVQHKKTKISDFFTSKQSNQLKVTDNGQEAANQYDQSISGSNATLALSDLIDDTFPATQEANDLFDEAFKKQSESNPGLTDSGYESSSPITLQSRITRTVDASVLSLPPANLTYGFAYELQSLALSWSDRAIDIWSKVVELCKTETPSAERRLVAYKNIANGRTYEPFKPTSWDPSAGLPAEKRSHRSAYQQATLSWKDAKSLDKSPFDLRLHAPHSQKSCRFHRQFGADRFLILNIPDRRNGILKNIPDREYRETLAEWLCDGIHLAHRHWRPFWVDDKTHQDKQGNWIYQVHLFATAGLEIAEPLSLRQFLNLHTPLAANINSADHKLFARGKLGLSKTIPTVILKPEEFRVVDDITSSDGNVMTDGCGLMSADLGVAIARKLNLEEVPSAFQGRIGGAKGMWLVDKRSSFSHGTSDTDFWIEIRPSQLKILPHPALRECTDDARTFEVSDWSKPLRPSALNTQLINVLYNGGVGREILGSRLKSFTTEYYDDLCNSLQRGDPLLTRAWLQKYHSGKSQHADFHFVGGRPINRVDQVKTYLDVGFSPKEHEPLHELITEILRSYLNEYVEKPRIELPRSTFAFMVPDVWGILQAGEVQLCLGQPWIDPVTGMESTFIAGIDGLVARNPANHPGDFQRVKLVHYAELAGYSNVIFFSTKDKRALADYLSGGDYDGDQSFVCWDQEIVKSFQNYSHGPPDHIKPKDVYLVKCSTPLRSVFDEGPNDGINDSTVTKYVKSCLVFSLRQSYVGIVTNTHVDYVYNESLRPGQRDQALESKGAITLAALAAFLVDAWKQGYDLPAEAWRALRKEICGPLQLQKPKYLECEETAHVDPRACPNILDHLRFKVARVQKNTIMKDWWRLRKLWPMSADDALLQPFRGLESDVSEDRDVDTRIIWRQLLSQLEGDLRRISTSWKRAAAPKDGKDLSASRRVIGDIYVAYKEIEPPIIAGHDSHWLCKIFAVNNRMQTNSWPSFRASFLYKTFKNHKFVWTMAGLELCEIKGGMMGPIVPVQARSYGTMKINPKLAKVVSETVVTEDEQLDLAEDEETQYFDAQTSPDAPPQPMTIRDYF